MKIVQSRVMTGDRPATPDWDGTGKHPILNMTMEEIRAHNAAAAGNYTPRANSDSKIKPLTKEEEDKVMEQLAREMPARTTEWFPTGQ